MIRIQMIFEKVRNKSMKSTHYKGIMYGVSKPGKVKPGTITVGDLDLGCHKEVLGDRDLGHRYIDDLHFHCQPLPLSALHAFNT